MKILFKPLVFFTLLILAVVLWSGGYFSILRQHEKTHSHTLMQHLQELRKFEVLQVGLMAHQSVSQSSYLKLNHNEFVIIAQARAVYGIDFSKNVDIKIEEDSIEVLLPSVEVFDVILNPNSFEYIGLSKGWFTSQSAFEELKHQKLIQLHNQMKRQARDHNYFRQSEKQAKQMVIAMLKTLGFKQIKVHFQSENRAKRPPKL